MKIQKTARERRRAGDESVDLTERGLDGLPPVEIRRGVPVEEQARDYVDALDLERGTRRGWVLHVVECAISERLPKAERPSWFETDAEILASLEGLA